MIALTIFALICVAITYGVKNAVLAFILGYASHKILRKAAVWYDQSDEERGAVIVVLTSLVAILLFETGWIRVAAIAAFILSTLYIAYKCIDRKMGMLKTILGIVTQTCVTPIMIFLVLFVAF